jgi:hypothetical protein
VVKQYFHEQHLPTATGSRRVDRRLWRQSGSAGTGTNASLRYTNNYGNNIAKDQFVAYVQRRSDLARR